MGERAYCSKHQRYLNDGGACVECEKIELALSYAQDIVNNWPTMTLRTMGQMTNRVNALREALELAKK